MPDFILYKRDGQITNTVKFEQVFTDLSDGKYLVRIEQFKKRSLPQNAYYWGVVVSMVKDGLRDMGYDEVKSNDDAHEILKHLFLKKDIVNKDTGEVVTSVARSTADLKTVEFNAFLEDVWKWAAEYINVTIPAPNEQLIMFAEFDKEVNATIVE